MTLKGIFFLQKKEIRQGKLTCLLGSKPGSPFFLSIFNDEIVEKGKRILLLKILIYNASITYFYNLC